MSNRTLRTTTLILNAIVVVFFVGFLAYTFVAREHVDSLARNFVTEKTVEYSQPLVKAAEEALDSPEAAQLPRLVDKAIRQEIAEYWEDPRAYVADLTRQARAAKVRKPNPLLNPLLEKIAAIKEAVRAFYDDTLEALVVDLRIFASSNLLAGVIAFILAWRSSDPIRRPIVWFSCLMLVAVIYCSSMYVDDLTFFRILLRWHSGWAYAVGLGFMVVGLWLDYGHYGQDREAAREAAKEAAEDEAASGPGCPAPRNRAAVGPADGRS